MKLARSRGPRHNAIMREADVAKTAVWRWQERFMQEGVDGLLRDKTRPPGKPPLPTDVVDEVVRLTQTEPPPLSAPPCCAWRGPWPASPGETTHWTSPAMAAATGISISSVQRIWKAHGSAPHRFRRFKLSNDPLFAAKLRDIVGPYVDPPAHAIVLSLDEKSQIQAPDRTQPGLPMKKGRLGTLKRRTEAVPMDRGTRPHHRCRQTREPSVGINPLD